MATIRRMVAWFDRRRLVIAALLAGWAVVVGLGAGAAPSSTTWIGIPSMERVVNILFAMGLGLGLMFLLLSLVFGRGVVSGRSARRSIWPLIVLAVLFLAVSSRLPRFDDDELGSEVSAPVAEEEVDSSGRGPVIKGGELEVLVLVLSAAVVTVVWTRRRLRSVIKKSSLGGAPTLEAALEPVIGRVVEGLDVGTDPRLAVMVAYAGLEHALADLGQARDPVETPTEYMGRVLSQLRIDPSPLIKLAGLYEVARFSDHAVSVDDQLEAAASLHRVRQALATMV